MSENSRKAKNKAQILYDGKLTPHRSCGICLAETFGLKTQSYQSLRRGGLTGEGECGAIKAGELVLGEILGDPNPTGAVTDKLLSGIKIYHRLWQTRVNKGKATSIICNELTGQFDEFKSTERATFCTNIAATVAECVAETLDELGVAYLIEELKLDRVRLHTIVTGVVQGVGFRMFTKRLAHGLGLLGCVRNLKNGSVEIIAEGEKTQLEKLIHNLKSGPVGARVENIKSTWLTATGQFMKFEITN